MSVTSPVGPRVGLTNTRERYGRVAQLFHWAVALLFLTQYPLAIVADNLPRATGEEVARVVAMFSWHKTIGVTIFALAVLRIGWALANPHPVLLNAEKKGEAFAAATIHWVLYAAILAMPLSGMVLHWASTGFAPLLIPFPEHVGFVPVSERVGAIAALVHKALGIAVLAAIALHVAGALKHHFIDRDATLRRMLPWASPALPRTPPAGSAPSTARTMATAWSALGVVALGALAAGFALAPEAEATAPREVAAAPAETAAAASVDAWAIDPASTLGLSITQLGSPVSGSFERWTGEILYDPDAPEAASIDVTVDLDSLTLGTVADQAKGPDFLAVETQPTARYRAEGFEPLGENRFRAEGTLTLRGAERPVPLEFDLVVDGDEATATGTAEIDRMEFGVGADGYPNEDSIGFGVSIDVDVTATRAEAAAPGS